MRHALKTRRYETRNRHFPPKQFSYLRVLRAVMFEISEEPPRSDCHAQNHAADARERHHSPRMAQYGHLGRNHRGAWTPMHLPRGAVRPNGQRAAPRRPHRIRRLAGMPRPRTQTDHSGRTQKIHPLMRPVPGAKQCIRALTQIRENTDSPAETHLRLLLKRYGFPEPIINVPVEATGNAVHGPAISDGLRPTQSGLAVARLVRRDSTMCCRLAAHDHVAEGTDAGYVDDGSSPGSR